MELSGSVLHFNGQTSRNIQETIGRPVCSTRFTSRSWGTIGEVKEDPRVSMTQVQRGDDAFDYSSLEHKVWMFCLLRQAMAKPILAALAQFVEKHLRRNPRHFLKDRVDGCFQGKPWC